MARWKKGQVLSACRRNGNDLRRLRALLSQASVAGDLKVWRRVKAVLGYIGGKTVIEMSVELGVNRSAIIKWLGKCEAEGADGLRTRRAPGATSRLTQSQRQRLVVVIESGPQSAGFDGGIWTGPMIGDWIRRHFGIRYHNHYVPYLLHQLGFSVQRPRKRLARADRDAQQMWLRTKLPAIKKKPRVVGAS